MSQIINWLCLICFSFLILEVMIYFCKDAIKILSELEKSRFDKVKERTMSSGNYNYEQKIAK